MTRATQALNIKPTPDPNVELLRCTKSPAYFIHNYVHLEDPDLRAWIPFKLWPAQEQPLHTIHTRSKTIILKARQLGLTWLCLAYGLWMMILKPGTVIMLFSRGDLEAMELVERLAGMHSRLPNWMRHPLTTNNLHEIGMSTLNGSRAQSFTTTRDSGRSFTGTLAIIDEADFNDHFKGLRNAVEPTIGAHSKIIVLSSVNKEAPDSEFKRLFKMSQAGDSNYTPVFIPWQANPKRTGSWYTDTARDKTPDDMRQEYPASVNEALSPKTESRRFNPTHIDSCFEPAPNLTPDSLWCTYKLPEPGRRYLIGVDTSEGNPSSHPSAATILDYETWEEVAHLWGKFEPGILAGHVINAAYLYNNAVICPERNNHGHVVILEIQNAPAPANTRTPPAKLLYLNPFDNKDGWLSNYRNKRLAIDIAADTLKHQTTTIHTEATCTELAGIDARTEKGDPDDRADSIIIAWASLYYPSKRGIIQKMPATQPEKASRFRAQ